MEQQQDRLLRLPEVSAITGLKRTRIYELMSAGKFPRAVPLGAAQNSPNGWLESEVRTWHSAWLRECVARRDAFESERKATGERLREVRAQAKAGGAT